MRHASIFAAGVLTLSAVTTARAQTPAADKPLYAMFTTGATVGHSTGALFGVEAGWRLNSTWEAFIEGGRMLDTATSEMDSAATVIAQFLGASATFTTKQPVTYFDVGVRYKLPIAKRLHPYLAAGVGAANVSRDVAFLVAGNDVTSQLLDQYGVLLGSDLAGKETRALVIVGVGAQMHLIREMFADFSYRYGRIFLSEAGLNTNRAQIGIGIGF